MPRFHDEWLIDRVLFEYVTDGGTSCSCCSIGPSSMLFMPGGISSLIKDVSDIDTDQISNEIQSLDIHPWPQNLRDHIWICRIKLRQRLKLSMYIYKQFWNKYSTEFCTWCYSNYILIEKRYLQLSRSEVLHILQTTYSVHSVYHNVLEHVIDQVAYFPLTDYTTDSKGSIEINFENILGFTRTGRGFYINLITNTNASTNTNDSENLSVDEEVLQILLDRIKSLGGPKLLERSNNTTTTAAKNPANNDNGDDDVENDDEDEGDADDAIIADTDTPANNSSNNTGRYSKISSSTSSKVGPSFASDRRIIRLIIARYWADILMKRFLDDQKTQMTSNNTMKTEKEEPTIIEDDKNKNDIETIMHDL